VPGPIMRSFAKRALIKTGLLELAAKFRSRGAAILMYHSVKEDPRDQEIFMGGIAHSRDVFSRQMALLARRYRPVGLDQVARFVRGESGLPQRAVVITFDDGYADNYEIAAPILNKIGVPATFYVTVECVEEGRLPWPARLRFVFRTTKKASWMDSSGKAWPLSNAVERENAYLDSCDDCCELAGVAQAEYVRRVEDALGSHVPVESGALMMNSGQMRELLQQGHMIGSHTMTHPNLAQVSLEEACRELSESKTRLEHHLGALVTHFSYPCPALSPHWTEQTVIASRDAGYETAVTTDGGLACRGDEPLTLKRVRPTKTLEGLQWNLECAFAGRSV
jgi:peptidoglycan/xylan/chitin deacetylase (PgdA/CDA1 family)